MKKFIAASCLCFLLLSLAGCGTGSGRDALSSTQGVAQSKGSSIQSTQQQDSEDTKEVIDQLKETADVLNSLDDVTEDDLTIPNP